MGTPYMSDPDGVIALWADMARLAIKDYRAGPAHKYFYSAEFFLMQAGLLDRVHERYGEPAPALGQLTMVFDDG